MAFKRLFKGISIASLMIIFGEAVLSCTLAEGVSTEQVHADAVAMLRSYHIAALVLAAGVLLMFFLRRFKGILILLFSVAALAISPGWSPDANAVLLPNCEPAGGFGVKTVLGVTAICFVAQLIFLIVERRKTMSVGSS